MIGKLFLESIRVLNMVEDTKNYLKYCMITEKYSSVIC